jgi:hypothetical protein
MTVNAPTDNELASALGAARPVWDRIVATVTDACGPLTQEWKPSKSDFGRMCLLKRGSRTILYLTPGGGTLHVAIVLGGRATAAALAGKLPEKIKALIREARPYAEGRGIRFPVKSAADVRLAGALVALKVAPK